MFTALNLFCFCSSYDHLVRLVIDLVVAQFGDAGGTAVGLGAHAPSKRRRRRRRRRRGRSAHRRAWLFLVSADADEGAEAREAQDGEEHEGDDGDRPRDDDLGRRRIREEAAAPLDAEQRFGLNDRDRNPRLGPEPFAPTERREGK